MYVKLIIFIIHLLLNLLDNAYLVSYWALNNDSPLIVYRKKISAFLFPFSTVFAKNFDA